MQDGKLLIKTEVLGKHGLIKNPEVITVQTIKAKHFEDMPEFNVRYDENIGLNETIRVIGEYRNHVILMIDKRLYKIHANDYIKIMAQDLDVATKEISDFVRGLPQIFTA